MTSNIPSAENMEGFEDFDPPKICEWLKKKGASEEILTIIGENDIDGRTFLDLNEQDLKDLSTSFKIRKQIRKFLEELHENDDGADGSDSPQFQRKRSASPPYLPQIQRPKKLASMRLATTDDYMYLIPKSEILDNPTHHSKQSIETERRRIVRISMDSLIGQNGGRPSEAELQMLARQMASQYPILRDRPSEGLRNNYNSLVGFLRRRMYNITPPVSTKGRKKGYNCIKKQEKNGENNSEELQEELKDNEEEQEELERKEGEVQEGGRKRGREGEVQEGGSKGGREGEVQEGGSKRGREGKVQEGGSKEGREGEVQEGGSKRCREGKVQEGGSKEGREGEVQEGGSKRCREGKVQEGGSKGGTEGEVQEGGGKRGREGKVQEGGSKGGREGEVQEGGSKRGREGKVQEGGSKGGREGKVQEGGGKRGREGKVQEGGSKGGREGEVQEGGSKRCREGKVQEGGRKRGREGEVQEGGSKGNYPLDGEPEILVLEKGQREKEKSEVVDKGKVSLMNALKRISTTTTSEDIQQLIRLSLEARVKEVEAMPLKDRLKSIMRLYKVFSCPANVIYNMYIQVPVEMDNMKGKLNEFLTTSLDMLFEKGIIKVARSTLTTTDEKYLVALFHLPILCGNTKSGGKLKPGHHLVHVVKSSEIWTDVAQSHRTSSGFWILHNTIGNRTSTMVMEKEDVLLKCSGAEEAILSMMGLYYLGILPYPAQVTGPLLLMQSIVLADKIHCADTSMLNKAKKEFDAYRTKRNEESLDSFF